MGVVSASARNSLNKALEVSLDGSIRGIPLEFALMQNYPNPFNPSTTIDYQMPSPSHVEIAVYNILGEKVSTLVNELQPAGYYTVQWNGRNDAGVQMASGLYFYRMRAADFSGLNKMLLIK